MKKTLAILAFVFATVFLNLKGAVSVEWENMYPLPESQFHLGAEKTPEGGVILVGYTGKDYIFAYKFSPEGEVVWMKQYGRGWADKVILLSDGNYLIAGTQENDELTWGYPLLMKINQNGDILWKKTYTELGIGDLRSVIEVPESFEYGAGFFSAGWVYFNNKVETGKSVYILRTDLEGNVKWQKVIQKGLRNLYFLDIFSYRTNEFTVASRARFPDDSEYSGYLLRVNDNSDVLLDKFVALNSGVARILPEEGGYFLVRRSGPDIFFSRYSLEGEFLWEKQQTVAENNRYVYIGNIFSLDDGSGEKRYFMIGTIEDEGIEIYSNFGDSFSLFLEVSPDGEILSGTIRRINGYWTFFSNIVPADNPDEFFLSGGIRKKYEYDWDLLLTKIKFDSPVPSRGLRGLVSFTQNERKFKLVWNSDPGKIYIVWGSTNLIDWTLQDAVYSTNLTTTWIDYGPIAPQKFFRVEER